MSLKEVYLGIQLGLSTAKWFFGICSTGDVAEHMKNIQKLKTPYSGRVFPFIQSYGVFGFINLLLVQ